MPTSRRLLTLTLLLLVLGLIAVADASAPQALNTFGNKYYFVKQQLLWAGLGLVAMVAVSTIPYKFWRKLATPLFIGNIILLMVVLIPGIGNKLLGARRWINLGILSIQPSEMIKFTVILYFAKLTENRKTIINYLIPLALVALLIMLQPDLGTTLVFVGIGFIQMFVAGVNLLYFVGAGLVGGVVAFLAVIFSDYRKERLLTFLKQTSDPLGSSYHIRQILLSLGMGGVFGVGLGASKQKYLFLPEATTDSIFAVVAEEIGFVGSVVIILLFGVFIYQIFRISQRAPDKFSQMVAIGIASWITLQLFLNIGSIVALVPLTGVPLPFFSYGGSSLLMLLLSVGILLNIGKGKQVKYAHARKRR